MADHGWLLELERDLRDAGGTFQGFSAKGHRKWRIGLETIVLPDPVKHAKVTRHARGNTEALVKRAIKRYGRFDLAAPVPRPSDAIGVDPGALLLPPEPLPEPLPEPPPAPPPPPPEHQERPMPKPVQCPYCNYPPFSAKHGDGGAGRHIKTHGSDAWAKWRESMSQGFRKRVDRKSLAPLTTAPVPGLRPAERLRLVVASLTELAAEIEAQDDRLAKLAEVFRR